MQWIVHEAGQVRGGDWMSYACGMDGTEMRTIHHVHDHVSIFDSLMLRQLSVANQQYLSSAV